MLIDSHCHLNEERLYVLRKQIIKEAQEKGVEKFIVIGWDYDSSFLAVSIAKEFDCCYATIGIMPTDIDSITGKDEKAFFDLLKEDKVVALGEIGLDYHWEKDEDKKQRQREWFIKQIKIANEYKKPIVIHSRDAIQETYNILKEYRPEYGGVMHCYSGSPEMVNDFIKLGLYIGLDGPVTFTNARSVKEVASIVPLDRLLVETDSPYLAPHPHRGEMNTSVYLPLIVEEIARCKNETYDKISEVTYSNTKKLFHV
ncbi:MAG: TatD family hydrolase [Coprobacillus sp.]|nr:TatD family hydrolase [Coprobacillus sp.]